MNFDPYTVVSLGGVTVGLSIIGVAIVRWWPGRKKAMKPAALLDLLPFTICTLYGMLLILSTGGLIGLLADWTLWGSSELGDAVLAYGFGSDTPAVTRTSHLALTPGGHSVVVIMTAVLVAVWCKKKGFRWDLFFSIVCGISLGLSSGVAGAVGYVLSPAVSTAGDYVVGLL